MNYCLGKLKGKILFKDKGIKKQVIVSQTPFSVACQPSGDCGVSGTKQITYTAANLPGIQTASISSFKNESLFFKAVPQTGAFDGNRYELWGDCNGTERLIDPQFSVAGGAITITGNTFTADANSTGLIIFSGDNQILFAIPVSECNYQIACDDDCPEGSHKCTHKKYPGYCCVPCKETGDRLKNMANKVGR